MERLHKYRGVTQQAEEDGDATRILRTYIGDVGVCMMLEGHEVPYKGVPDGSAVHASDVVKKMLQGRFFDAAWLCMEPHILEPWAMTAFSRELCRVFDGRLGVLIAHVLEYDAAYRFRIQDLISEMDKDYLLASPVRASLTMVKVSRQRDYDIAHKKMRRLVWITCGLLMVPWFRNRVKELDWSRLRLDDNDKYWLRRRVDYRWPYVV